MKTVHAVGLLKCKNRDQLDKQYYFMRQAAPLNADSHCCENLENTG